MLPVVYICISHFFYSFAFIIRYLLGRQNAACDSHGLLIQSNASGNNYCTLIYALASFFSTTATAWFVVLNLAWCLSTTRRFSPEAVESYSSLFHLFAWGSGALWMVVTLLFGSIHGDDLSGMCSLEYGSGMSMAPDLAMDSVSLLLFLIGLVSMIQIKLEIETPKLIQLSRLKLMVRRVTLFVLVYLATKVL